MNSSPAQDKRHALWFRAALQNRLIAALCHCIYTYGYLLFIQVCSDPDLMHSTPDQDKRHALWFRAALQNRMTAPMCDCNDTYGYLLFIWSAVPQI